MLRQAIVQEREVRPYEVEDAPVLSNHRAEKEFRFRRHCAAQPFVEVREESIVGTFDCQEVAKIQPLAGEVFGERLRPGVGQHPVNLRPQCFWAGHLSARCEIEKLVVRNAAPQKERQPRGQLQIGEPIRVGSGTRGIELDAEQELGADEQPFDRLPYTDIEPSFGAASFVEAQERRNIRGGHRTPERAASQRREDSFCAGCVVGMGASARAELPLFEPAG
jgi:hypothetical protein